VIFERVPLVIFQAGLVLAWSSAFLGAILASETGSILRVMLWRFVGVALLFMPFLYRTLRRGVTLRWWLVHGMLGALGMFACIGLGQEAINLGLPAGTASLIAALQPLATAVFAGPILGERVLRGQWVGLSIGLLGVALSVGSLSNSEQLLGYLCAFGSMSCIVIATLIAKAMWNGTDLPSALAVQAIVTAILVVPLAIRADVFWPQLSLQFLGALAWAIVFSTLGGYGLYYICLVRSNVVRTSSLIYLTPPVTLLWAWMMFGQPISIFTTIGFLLCLAGVYLAVNERGRSAKLGTEEA
jgi:drug/metabolite transporter (DMT)-like permease